MYVSLTMYPSIDHQNDHPRSSICVTTMNRLMLNLRDPELTEPPGANTAWRNDGTSTGFSTEYITTSVEPGPSRDIEEYHRRMDHVAVEIQDVSPITGSSRI